MALQVLQRDPKIALLGLIQSLFEGSMYIFVFMWTPKMEPHFAPLPHGRIFGCFMACLMLGSACLGPIAKRFPAENYTRTLFAISALTMAVDNSQTSVFHSIYYVT